MRSLFLSLGVTGGLAVNPITRVAELLQGLTKQIEADGKAEEKLFKKYECWYKQTTKEKTESNAEATGRIEQLTSYIDDIKNGRIEFTSERQDLEKELAKINHDLETAKNLRDQENEDFEAAKAEMDKAITALKEAVKILTEKTKGSFLSNKFELRKALEFASSALSKSDARFLERVLDVPEKDWEKLNRKATFKNKYNKRSGEIQDTLKTMLQTFEDNLSDATTKEKRAQDTYEKLKASKEDEKASTEDALQAMESETGARGMNLAQAEEEKEQLETQVANDEKFLKQVQDSYDTKMGEYKERKKLRTEELAGISEAISILRSDDARDLFKKSFESQGYLFLQTSKQSNNDRAVAQLTTTMRRSGDKRLSKVVARLQQNMRAGAADISAVIDRIDDMIKDLEKEATDDQKWKEQCEEEVHDEKKESLKQARIVDDEQATIERETASIEELEEKIEVAKETIKKIEEQLEEAKRVRADEHKEFQQSKQDDKAAVVLIANAITALEKFYKNNNLIQVAEPGQAPVPPPSTWEGGYGGKKGENDGVVGILTMIKQDVEKDIAEAQAQEDASEKEYQDFKTNGESDIVDQKDQIDTFKTTRAKAEADRTDAESSKKSAQEQLDGAVGAFHAIEPKCIFIGVNFHTRKDNRVKEMDGLKKAKRILQNSD